MKAFKLNRRCLALFQPVVGSRLGLHPFPSGTFMADEFELLVGDWKMMAAPPVAYFA